MGSIEYFEERGHIVGKIVSPRLEKLEKEFLDSGGEWVEKSINYLFQVISSKAIFHANQVDIYDEQIDGSYPYIVRSTNKNGIRGYLKLLKVYLNPSNTITFAQDTFVAFYQEQKYFTGNKVKILYPKFPNFNKKQGLFISSLINKSIKDITWGQGSTEESIGEIRISLPFLNGEIYFFYMEKYIEELEALRIEELEAYLVATGLKDYHLTKYDEEILDKFNRLSENSTDRQTDKIRLEDILDWQTSIKELNPLHLNKISCIGEKYPFYGQATENNGIISYISLIDSVLNNKNALPTILIHSNNQNIVYLETPFYLKDGHGATSVLQNKNMNKHSALYLMGTIQKVIKDRFNYNAKATKIGLKNTLVEVPLKGGKYDFQFMEDFIRVIEKLVIKDVVLWADKKIQATKQVIAKN